MLGRLCSLWKKDYCLTNQKLKKSRSEHLPLYRAIKKYGINAFTYETIDKAYSREELDFLEKHHISTLGTQETGLNVDAGGRGRSGFKLNDKQTEALYISNSKPKTKEHKANISRSHKGMKKPWVCTRNKQGLSKETRQKISETLKQFNSKRKENEIFPHGEPRGYWRGCKCVMCKKAAASYALNNKKNRKRRNG